MSLGSISHVEHLSNNYHWKRSYTKWQSVISSSLTSHLIEQNLGVGPSWHSQCAGIRLIRTDTLVVQANSNHSVVHQADKGQSILDAVGPLIVAYLQALGRLVGNKICMLLRAAASEFKWVISRFRSIPHLKPQSVWPTSLLQHLPIELLPLSQRISSFAPAAECLCVWEHCPLLTLAPLTLSSCHHSIIELSCYSYKPLWHLISVEFCSPQYTFHLLYSLRPSHPSSFQETPLQFLITTRSKCLTDADKLCYCRLHLLWAFAGSFSVLVIVVSTIDELRCKRWKRISFTMLLMNGKWTVIEESLAQILRQGGNSWQVKRGDWRD